MSAGSDDLSDLAGDVSLEVSDQHSAFSDDYPQNLRVALVTQQLGPAVKYAAWVPMSAEVMADPPAAQAAINMGVDRYLRPWRYPDRIDWPAFVPLPRLAAWVENLRARRQRYRDAWAVLRGRESVYDPDENDW